MRILQLTALFVLIALYALVKIPGAVLALKPYGIDLYRLGDLYRYSYLSQYRDTTEVYPHPPAKSKSNFHLFVLGDSFTGSFSKDHYPTVKQYSFANWNQFSDRYVTLKTDSGEKNILLVTCSEKNIRLRFAKNQMGIYLAKSAPKGKPGFQISEHPSTPAEQLKKYLGRPEVSDQNIQAILFSNEFALRIKEFKAQFNLAVFGKIAGEVEEYKAKNMLFQRLTTDPKYVYMSSFRELEKSEEDELINSIKRLTNHYKRVGFDSVVLAFIPNPVSVIAPNFKGQQYNQLIPKLEDRMSETGAGCISIFNDFSEGRETFYRRGDTHWNARGAKLWLNRANSYLDKIE
jgi:hypothetical protein